MSFPGGHHHFAVPVPIRTTLVNRLLADELCTHVPTSPISVPPHTMVGEVDPPKCQARTRVEPGGVRCHDCLRPVLFCRAHAHGVWRQSCIFRGRKVDQTRWESSVKVDHFEKSGWFDVASQNSIVAEFQGDRHRQLLANLPGRSDAASWGHLHFYIRS